MCVALRQVARFGNEPGSGSSRARAALKARAWSGISLTSSRRSSPAKEELLAVAREQSLTADFFCYWVSATGHGGPEIGADTLRRISELGASLGFDQYGPWDDE